MKTHYVYSQLHHVAACGQDSKLNYIQVTTDASEITCMSCVRCLEGYTQRISDIRVKYEIAIKIRYIPAYNQMKLKISKDQKP